MLSVIVYIYIRTISKNGYTRSIWSQKRVHPGIKSKIHPTSHAIGQNKSYPFLRDDDPGTPVNGVLCWLSTFLGYIFCLTISRTYSCTLFFTTVVASLVTLFCFLVHFCSFNFHDEYEFQFTIQPLDATWARTSTNSCAQTMRVSLRLLYYLSADSMKQKTGTHRDQVKNTRWPPHKLFRGFSTLDPTQKT